MSISTQQLMTACAACGSIHYQNPKMVIGAIPEWGTKILLCRRAIEPRSGLWTLPAGFMENGETTAEAAMREVTPISDVRASADYRRHIVRGLFKDVLDTAWGRASIG